MIAYDYKNIEMIMMGEKDENIKYKNRRLSKYR